MRWTPTAIAVAGILVTACAPSETVYVEHEAEPGESFFGAVRQLTFGGQNAEAYFSPDGGQLIFQRTTTDSTCDQQYIMNVDGTDLRRVSNGLGRTTCGFFYQGGDRILYSSTFHVGDGCPALPDFSRGYVWSLYDYDIYTARMDGSELEKLFATDGYDGEATLSPDGQTVVFTSTRDGDLDIYTMNIDGTDVRRLTTKVGYDGGPFFSPDGKTIVYRAWYPTDPDDIADYQALLAQNLVRPSRMEIFVMNADGSEQRQLTDLGGANFAPYFHPSGEKIIFASNHEEGPRSRNFDLFLVNVDGSGLTKVTNTPTFDSFPMFSPDGTKLVFASNRHGSVDGETNIFIVEWIDNEE